MRDEALPGECWEAIEDYLAASGRRDAMMAEDYVFAPLNEHWSAIGGHAGEWTASKPMSTETIYKTLQRYVEWAELGVEKLRLSDLRHSAVMLRVRAGAEVSEIRAWLGLSYKGNAKRYLEALEGQSVSEERLEAAKRIWKKGPYRRKQGSTGHLINLKHGYYSEHLGSDGGGDGGGEPLNPEASNLDALIERMNMILEHTFKLVIAEPDPRENVRLLDIYGRASDRMLRSIDRARKLKDDEAVVTLNQVLEEIAEEFEKGTLGEYFKED